MIQIRRKVYRGEEGWSITGTRPGQAGGWPVSIFVETTRDDAVWIREQVNAGREWSFDDMPSRRSK